MIKKINFAFVFLFTLTSCAAAPTSPPPPPPNTPTEYVFPTSAVTVTPTLPTPTFTLTPTLVGYKSPTPTPKDTSTPSATATVFISSITPNTPTPVVKMEGFVSILASDPVFYYGEGCEPKSVKFTVQTSDVGATFVVLFTRFISRTSGAKSAWTSITMDNGGAGVFTHVLTPQEMIAVDSYTDPWVQFQFVATSASSKEVGRTGFFDKQLSMLTCSQTDTPTPLPTPTVLKP